MQPVGALGIGGLAFTGAQIASAVPASFNVFKFIGGNALKIIQSTVPMVAQGMIAREFGPSGQAAPAGNPPPPADIQAPPQPQFVVVPSESKTDYMPFILGAVALVLILKK